MGKINSEINKANKFANLLSNARKNNKVIERLPKSLITNDKLIEQIRIKAENSLCWNTIGFKVGATNSKIISKLKAKQPFFSKIFKEKYFKNNSKLILPKNLLGIELEVAFKIDKKIFRIKKVNKKNILKNILSAMPIIELVGFRQNIRTIQDVNYAVVDFGLNVAVVNSKYTKFKRNFPLNSKTFLKNVNTNKIYTGHTNEVLGNPINVLLWLFKELKKKNIHLNKNVIVATGTTTPIVPVKKGDKFLGHIKSLGNVRVNF